MTHYSNVISEFSERIKSAVATKTPLNIQGGGTKNGYGQTPQGELFSTLAYSGIIDYDPSELVLTARCGTPLSTIQAALEAEHQFLAFEPPSFGQNATIGGVVAAGIAGPRRAYAGGLRDFVLGAVLMNNQAEQLHFGGQVMKNVAGYDVSRMLAGSLGCLGLITEVSIKVLPKPQSEISLAFDMDEATALAKLNFWGGKPLPMSASSWLNGCLMVRLSGSIAATEDARQQLGGELIDAHIAQQHWHDLREQTHAFFNPQSSQNAPTVWRISLPSTAPALDIGAQLIEWGGAQRWLVEQANAAPIDVKNLRQQVAKLGGHVTLFKGGNKAEGVFEPLPAPLMAIHQRLKQSFDPAGIFNPRRMYLDF